MLGLSPLELAVIAILFVLFFGTRRLPELGSGFGKAISNFKKAYSESTAIDVTPKKDDQKNLEEQKGENKEG